MFADSRRSRSAGLLPFAGFLALGWAATAAAQATVSAASAELATTATVTRIHALGQPRRWSAYTGAELGSGWRGTRPGAELLVGARRSLHHPVTGLLGLRVEGFGGTRGQELDGGARVLLDVPTFFLEAGAEASRGAGLAPRLGLSLPAARGGWPLPGALLRVAWSGGGADRVSTGLTVPVGDRLAGRTRPRTPGHRLPAGQPAARVSVDGDQGAEVLRAMAWVHLLHNLYWLTAQRGIGADERPLRAKQALTIFLAELREREALAPGTPAYAREVEHYHRALDAWFEAAAPVGGGRGLAAAARAAMLDELVLPYNRAIGRRKVADRIDGLLQHARGRFEAEARALPGLEAIEIERALAVFDGWASGFEEARRALARWTGDSRAQWIPLALVLRPEDHDTPEEVEAYLARGLDRPLSEGNRVRYFDAHAFQDELVRTLRATERYHVLWIHDFRGRRDDGAADRAGFDAVTRGYLPALIEAVRRYDETGRLPAFFVLLDQFFYETNGGRVWMQLLENPLAATVRLPGRPAVMEADVRALQASLRAAVAGSQRLQAEAARHGRGWIEQRVRVHVNITNPSDFSFRSRQLFRFPVGADNVMRDHRKVVVWDLDPADPYVGEAILTGMGVGDHYSEPGWDDRSILVQGPGALEAMREARRVLEDHGLRGDRLPAPFRAFALDNRTAGRPTDGGGAARLIQVHNRTGWDEKEASFLQMLLYDLVPPGTVLYVPDSLWTSPEWMAQLVSAALRGCRVHIVAPALDHAPAPGFPQMSEARELLTAALVLGEVLAEVIEAAGGELRVGLYARTSSTEDPAGRVDELVQAYARHPVPGSLFPLSRLPLPGPVGAPSARRPMLHQKTQLLASGDVLAALASAPETPVILEQFAARRLSEEEAAERFAAAYRSLPDSLRSRAVLFLLVGTLNKNVRSMALDGEAVAALAGDAALTGYLDFLLLTGSIHWVERAEQLDPLLPAFPELKRQVGRWLLRIL